MLILDQSEPLIPIFVFLSSENYLLLSPRGNVRLNKNYPVPTVAF